MMGTLAAVLARKGIKTPEDLYWAEVEGDIDNVNGVLKITQIRVKYHVTAEDEKTDGAREAFASYLASCPAAQSVIGCIDIKDSLVLHPT
jgi:organic hydroperoxide reductase OsmC/OhrA